MNRKGMELSVNTLVVLILGIMIISGGFMILRHTTEETKELLEIVGKSTQEKIDAELNKQIISIPDNERTISRYGSETFGLGFKNTMAVDKFFLVKFSCLNAFASDGTNIRPANCDDLITYPEFTSPQDYLKLAPGEVSEGVPFRISIPTGSAKGTYVFEADVWYNKISTSTPDTSYAKKQIRIALK